MNPGPPELITNHIRDDRAALKAYNLRQSRVCDPRLACSGPSCPAQRWSKTYECTSRWTLTFLFFTLGIYALCTTDLLSRATWTKFYDVQERQ